MSSSKGALALPITVVEEEDAAGDPLLTLLGQFLAAAINHECADAWEGLAKQGNLPVNAIFTFDPKRRGVESKKFPALYIWRMKDGADHQIGDLHVSTNTICILWVQGIAGRGAKERRDSFWHGIMAAARSALTADRHPAWTHPDDATAGGAYYGSCFSKWANLYTEPKVGETKPETLMVEFVGSNDVAPTFSGGLMMLNVDENSDADGPVRIPFSGGVRGSIKTGDDQEHTHLEFQTGVKVFELSATSGAAAGGETITILGNGFAEDCTVSFGTTDAATVTFESETELTVETPAHAAGLVDVTVTNPSGESGALTGAFTFA